MNKIKCPSCGTRFEPSEAFKHELEEKLSKEADDKLEERTEEIRKNITKQIKAEAQENVDKINKENEIQILRLKKRAEDAEGKELEIRKKKQALEEEKEKFEIDKERQLDEERQEIKNKAIEAVEERDKLKFAEYEKKLKDLSDDLKIAQAKSEQGSQQLQGDILELDLKKTLEAAYTDDEINPVGKGTAGGDIIQKVKGKSGRVAGTILWETKRAKWQPSWKAKLREDAQKSEVNIAVLVCTNLPSDIDNFKMEKGIIISSYKYALPLAGILRRSILQIAVAKQAAENKDENLELLYQYFQSESFRHRFEAFAEGIVQMQQDLDTEKRSMERSWKKRETQINKVLLNTSRMYGELQGTMGNALPDIKVLSLPEKIKE
jgi:hypothetical protein